MAKAKRKTPDRNTLRELFLKSGNICAFPGCIHLMMNKDGEFIGQICHIEAAEEGGERFNPNMTDEERAAFPNVMLMCYEHHVVTNDVDEYPAERLRAMKAEHEAKFTDPTRAMEEGYARQIAGEGGISQQGNNNRAITTGANTGNIVMGHNATIIQGTFGAPPDLYSDLDHVMGEFLDELREQLRNHPSVRDIILMEGSGTPNFSQPAFLFRDQKFPDITSWVDTLEARGLVRDATKGGLRRVRMTHGFVKWLYSTTTPKTRLSEHAARLVVNAAASDGNVMVILHSGGLSVQAGTLQLVVPHDKARSQGNWRSAIQELLNVGFLTSHGSNELFDLTKEGWEFVEALGLEPAAALRAKTED